ncbi:uncharacterized protein BCR38DRAFT_139302 [Pseudomassariella vexata]|uniref:Uncharacterized protein n=1 Tax=Pseudomassariella vexata TaxID=1141098 RepID=A0A1Y2EB57_9PEZI|nr:uncharacterized protein BCR38DRAFT_139302 [Pseudomassariella vexata]ORY68809.1 hypothetical protein BCR38DRAFT_139302 [Pseudomassariella vexata]
MGYIIRADQRREALLGTGANLPWGSDEQHMQRCHSRALSSKARRGAKVVFRGWEQNVGELKYPPYPWPLGKESKEGGYTTVADRVITKCNIMTRRRICICRDLEFQNVTAVCDLGFYVRGSTGRRGVREMDHSGNACRLWLRNLPRWESIVPLVKYNTSCFLFQARVVASNFITALLRLMKPHS